MKKLSVLFIIFIILISACSQTSDWKMVVISKDDKIVFLDRDSFFKEIAIPVKGNDTLFISNIRLIERACYLKMAL